MMRLMYGLSRDGCLILRCNKDSYAVPMTIENQIIDFLYTRRGQMLCHRCLRRAAVLPDLPEIEVALDASGAPHDFAAATRSAVIAGSRAGFRGGVRREGRRVAFRTA